MARLRIYVTGRVSIEYGTKVADDRHLAGRQGRIAFVYLAANRHRHASRSDLVSAIWPDRQPEEVEVALSAILSKLRAVFRTVGLRPADAGIDVGLGAIELRLPLETWVDIDEAANAVDEAEGAMRSRDRERAWGLANVAVTIARRPFLADEDAPWVESRRTKLRALLMRGLHCLSSLSAEAEPSLAVQYAKEMIDLEPFSEMGYQHLMRLHAQMGNRGEALRVFGRCRDLFRDELGASPSSQTEAVFLEILRAGE